MGCSASKDQQHGVVKNKATVVGVSSAPLSSKELLLDGGEETANASMSMSTSASANFTSATQARTHRQQRQQQQQQQQSSPDKVPSGYSKDARGAATTTSQQRVSSPSKSNMNQGGGWGMQGIQPGYSSGESSFSESDGEQHCPNNKNNRNNNNDFLQKAATTTLSSATKNYKKKNVVVDAIESPSSSVGVSNTTTIPASSARTNLKTTTNDNNTNKKSALGCSNGVTTTPKNSTTRSDILALSSLREEMVKEGDLTQTVVRIENPFGKPIEEIYEGVHDGEVLGSGVSGIVRLVTHIETRVKYAVKILDIGLIRTIDGLRRLRNEIFIMCQLDHPNIVRIEEVYESADEIYIVQELCTGGDLYYRLDEQPDYHYTEPQCAKLVKQMLSSIRYLHSKGIIHRDLKLENFLFSTTDNDSALKMIDFGLSKHFELGQQHHEKVGTPYIVAPEIILGEYNEKSDLWALGVITFLLLSGETPFGGLEGEQGEELLRVKEKILHARVLFEPDDIWETVSVDAKRFVCSLLNPDTSTRPTAKEAQKDPWIQIWAKKDVDECKTLNPKTIQSLVTFKEYSDMQKLLSEVLSFTLLPEQIVELRKEFEKIDTEDVGEISLMSLKQILRRNAENGALGALTEKEIEDIFDTMCIRKNSEPTIRWHEFLAAGLSQAHVDDRNLRLAFDRIDVDRKGFITFDNLHDLLGCTESHLEKIWLDSLKECQANLGRISYDQFKVLMKGQSKQKGSSTPFDTGVSLPQPPMMELSSSLLMMKTTPSIQEDVAGHEDDDDNNNQRSSLMKSRSSNSLNKLSLDSSNSSTSAGDERFDKQLREEQPKQQQQQQRYSSGNLAKQHQSMRSLVGNATRAVLNLVSNNDDDPAYHLHNDNDDSSVSSLVVNRILYRKHREMRLGVLEASKQFDKKRRERRTSMLNKQSNRSLLKAGLIMKRGAVPPEDYLDDAHTRALFDAASKRCGRARRTRNKTVSDVTGMMLSSD